MDITMLCLIAGVTMALISGIVQMLKVSLKIPKNKIPIISCFVGVVVGLVLQPFSVYSFYTMGVAGFIAGLASCGFFDLSKVIKKDK